MENRWRDDEAAECIARHGAEHGEDLALCLYASRLIGADSGLVLHGGGNTSFKGRRADLLGELRDALFVKASGHDLARLEPEGLVAVDLAGLTRLRALDALSDPEMTAELRRNRFDHRAGTPSVETLLHALIPAPFIVHSHADAVLALTNQTGGAAQVSRALGGEVVVVPYVPPGFELSKAVAAARDANPQSRAMVWMLHGIVTWGETAREAYDLMIELVSRAEDFLDRGARPAAASSPRTSIEEAEARLAQVAPLVRGRLMGPSGDGDRPHRRMVLRPLVSREALDAVDAEGARELLVSSPLTADHLIRTKALPAWVEAPAWDDEARLTEQLDRAIGDYVEDYGAYVERHASRLPPGVPLFDPLPRVVLMPGLGALCAGRDASAAAIARDITRQTIAAKGRIAAMGAEYQGLAEDHLFDMEYRVVQHAKLSAAAEPPLVGTVALITGAAGAIGSGIAEGLLEAGAHVALSDLEGTALGSLATELEAAHPGRAIAVPLDVTDAHSVAAGFAAVSRAWGGVDLVVINAGLAHVATLEALELEAFRRLQQVNTEGTLLLLAEAGRHLRRQGTGGDIVLVSTKNVFAPGAGFGAYSATKAAAHQLARVASLEFAADDIRVNMVAPDAVFAHGARKSGLWAEVGPERMKARGLDSDGLETYYRERNLLKARVTARHVANAVLFLATRQTPTTGATIPVDGGLPEATPR